jgi:hypothetical protein
MTASKNCIASEVEIDDFRSALTEIGYSLVKFCELVAVNEGDEDPDQEGKIVQNVKKSFGRKMKQTTLNKYWDYISELPEFQRVDRVVLGSSKKYLSRSDYRDKIISAFDVD